MPPTSTNHLSPQLIEHKKKRPRHMMLEIQVLAWNRHKKCGGIKLVNGIPTLLFLIIG
jgi:hypothetical protein